jgi:ABC-type nickel/cobalt efflux system permease component RcnA
MSKFFSLTTFVAVMAVACWGCTADTNTTPAASSTTSEHADHDHADHDHAHGKLCGSCGTEKGTESCCSETAEKCECGMAKGSALCCVELDASAKGKDLCTACGHVAGSTDCCAEGAEKCDCGMAKGSPLCCKLKSE